jgi:hypothetical protein
VNKVPGWRVGRPGAKPKKESVVSNSRRIYLATVMTLFFVSCSSDAPLAHMLGTQIVQRTDSNTFEPNPMSKEEVALDPKGQIQTDLGVTESLLHDGGDKGLLRVGATASAPGTTYVNHDYGFSIDYPANFVVHPENVSKMSQFEPKPVASILFMNPSMAKGALAGLEPSDLAVRVYQQPGVNSLKEWLTSVGLLNEGATSQPYVNGKVEGVKVCQSTLIAPGCSMYILRNGRVYQLTPNSREGEAMVETFALLSGK